MTKYPKPSQRLNKSWSISDSFQRKVTLSDVGKTVSELVSRVMPDSRPELPTPSHVAALCHDLVNLEQENLVSIYLNANGRVLARRLISIGNHNSAIVDPRIVFKFALELKAVALILVHNHPSGSPEPSQADIDLLSQLSKAGELLNISVLDHIIVSSRGHYSISRSKSYLINPSSTISKPEASLQTPSLLFNEAFSNSKETF